MKNLLPVLMLWLGLAAPAHSAGAETGYVVGLDYVAQTSIPGPDGAFYALCHTSRELKLLGLTLTRTVTGFALSQNGCLSASDRIFTADQVMIAQSLGLVDSDVAVTTRHDGRTVLAQYGLWIVVALALLAVIIRRMRSILGYVPGAALRKKAMRRILLAMCHVAKCDGIVAAAELSLIGETIRRLTGRAIPASEIIRIVDQIGDVPSPAQCIGLGQGLFDYEKDVMIRAVLSVAIASGRIFPAEYQFATDLAHGLGMPAEDFRRVLHMAISDRSLRAA